MKQLLILFFALLSVGAKGQTDSGWIRFDSGPLISHYSVEMPSVQDKYDTIQVNMLCSDTAFSNGHYWSDVYKVRGYEVRNGTYGCCMPVSPNANGVVNSIAIYGWKYEHLSYLDEKKKPLTYFVWLSKPL